MAMQPMALDAGFGAGDGRGLARRLRRPALALAAAALALSVAGDRSRAAGVPARVAGSDPLEVLELKVRPNVILLLDSSGSMQWWVTNNNFSLNSGDHPRSRLNQAKRVLRQVVQNNQDKVSFEFGTYTQYGGSFGNQTAGAHRFQYVTNNSSYPFMSSGNELTVRRASGDAGERGLQSWQMIYTEWGTLRFEESGSITCAAVIPATPKFYATGASLAADLQAAMNAASCGKANTYTVTYDGTNGRFTFGATGPNQFRLSTGGANNIQGALGGLDTSWATAGSAATTTTLTPTVTGLERRTGHTRVNVTSVPALLAVGDSCTIAGAAPAFFNGTWTVSSLFSGTQFRLNGPLGSTTPSTTSGTITCTHTSGAVAGTTVRSNTPYTLLYRTTGTGSSGTGLNLQWTFTETISGTATTFYQLRAGRFWNGETIRVNTSGEVCGMDFASATTKTKPASITVAEADATCTPTGNTAIFEWGGGSYTGNSRSCNGYRGKSQLIPCDLASPPAPTQFTTIGPYIEDELPLDANGDPADWNADGTRDYQEAMDGTWRTTTINIAPSARAAGSTPIANSLIDIKGTANAGDTSCITNATAIYPALDNNAGAGTTGACVERGFTRLWNTGLSTGPWASVPAAQRAIRNHNNPKEKTIVIVVTDGDDTCGSRTGTVDSGTFTGSGSEPEARRAAYYAEELFRPINAAEPASSVQTYVVGYGGSFPATDPFLLNIIAWGGSGLGQNQPGQPNVDWQGDSQTTLRNARARCTTCTDAFVAPDAVTLANALQAIIDQGASDGDFNAQQSITESVFEYVDLASTGTVQYDAAKPGLRYKAIVPTRFISSFTLPGFKGQQRAYQNNGSGGTVQKWSAGDVLREQVAAAMAGLVPTPPVAAPTPANTPCNTGSAGGASDECVFQQLHGGATDANIRTSTAKIKRRIYTTTSNGLYPYTVDTLIDGTSSARVALWPPTAPGLLHTTITDNVYKAYDQALGLPPDGPTSFPPNPVDPKCDPADTRPTIATPKKAYDECWFGWLQTRLQACNGSSLPAACTAGTFAQRMQAARREAREISLAFLAGAATIPSSSGAGIKRTTAAVGTSPTGSILYKARSWILADSELATAAVVTPPLPAEPTATPYLAEYSLFRDGPRVSGTNAERSVGSPAQVKMGFGLRSPDADGTVATAAVDTKVGLKPVMTVLYAPANDMLHAFRAGPCDTPGLTVPCNERGGEELWGFLPFDQLHTVLLRAAFEPQGKTNHVYAIARGVRFSDIFVPGAYSRTLGTGSVSSAAGVWRRVLFFGRGIGGKHVTALDVTGPGPYTEYALDTTPPVPLWSRGNPDTANGLVGGAPNGDALDAGAYATMGETWSIPVIGYVDKTNPIYNGVEYALFMGSGYSSVAGEGTTFYTLNALTGKVIATADVGSRSGFTAYPNALVANPVGFNPKVFSPLTTVHPAAAQVTRLYIGDVHGRMWKFLTARPDVALPLADLGTGQPVGVAASLLGLPPQPGVPIPYVFVNSGADQRAAGPFQMFAFRDDGTDTDIAIGAGSTAGTVTTYLPAVQLFSRFYDQGTPDANCGYTTEAVFRGTVQPAAAFECSSIAVGSCSSPVGRVFYAGTRLSLPNTRFAPITPLACGSGVYPCRSQFDSTIYALGAQSGLPAYDLNASGDDAYRIFRDSRIAAITVQADPDPGRGGSSFTPDEGLMKGTPKPPPPPGVPPTATTATANVVMVREPGQPAPAIRYGSTVCQ